MALSTQKSSTTSRTVPDLIGEHRLRVPFRINPVARQCISLVWYDDSDREALFRIQQALRLSPQKPVDHASPAVALPWDQRRAMAILVVRCDIQQRHRARHLFAAAAHRQAPRFQIRRSVDMLAVYAGLVEGYATRRDIDPVLMAMIGGALLDEGIIKSMYNSYFVEFVVRETYIALANQYPQLATIPEDEL